MSSVVVIQARTNSNRLPGKVFLPVGGFSLVILAAKRASNTGRMVIVTTSYERMDDQLALLLGEHDIRCSRGSLDNVLERVVNALKEYDDETLVFRLTADNVFPDGSLLDEIEEDFGSRNLDYLCCNGTQSGLPHGMSAELTKLKHLRDADKAAKNVHDKEHVTPIIRRKFGDSYFTKYLDLHTGHYRCTVDCLDDYLAIRDVFSGVDSPIDIPAMDLLRRLPGAFLQPSQSRPVNKLVLGTAQLGMDYGITNRTGKPNAAAAEFLVKMAIANGTNFIDTAHSYGDSETIIGKAIASGWGGRVKIITKLSPMAGYPEDAASFAIEALVEASIYKSCMSLCKKKLDVVMLHRASHLTDWNGAVWNKLIQLKAEGVIEALGISVQSPTELEAALEVRDVQFIQMPFNVLDWRWDHLVTKLKTTKEHRDLVVHTRSVLLQGLLLSTDAEQWGKANVPRYEVVTSWLTDQALKFSCGSLTELCLSYVKSHDWIDGVVVGVDSVGQLSENLKILDGPDMPLCELDYIKQHRPQLDQESLNPAYWTV